MNGGSSARANKVALLSGGGSGGHVFPGLAVAGEMRHRGWRVDWAGSPGAMEERLVGREGLTFHGLKARPVVGRGVVGKVSAVATLMTSAWAARGLVKRTGARVVLGTGGYVSAPAVLGARLAGVPSLLLEPNADAGLANRMMSRFAAEALLAHGSTAQGLRCPGTTTGVPVRREFFAVQSQLPPASPLRVLVLGGSQGAGQLNRLMPAALKELPTSVGSVVVRHQCGHKHVEATRQAYVAAGLDVGSAAEGLVRVEVVPFLHEMADAMAESHLIVSRAGAITLAEICAAGRPSLLLPLTLAAGHQRANAERLQEAGAAQVFLERDGMKAGETGFGPRLGALLSDSDGLASMAAAARALGRADSAQVIADRLEHWSGEARNV